jgi:hypothetical protein
LHWNQIRRDLQFFLCYASLDHPCLKTVTVPILQAPCCPIDGWLRLVNLRGVDTGLRFCSRQLWNVRIFRVFSWNAWIVGVFYELLTKFNKMRELLTKFHEMRKFLPKYTDFQKIFFVYSGQNAIILATLASQVYAWAT